MRHLPTELISSVRRSAVNVTERSISMMFTMEGESQREVKMSLKVAQELANELRAAMASAYQQLAGGGTHGDIELRVPLQVDRFTVTPDVTGQELAIMFEAQQSFALLWAIDWQRADQLAAMILRAREMAEKGASVRDA